MTNCSLLCYYPPLCGYKDFEQIFSCRPQERKTNHQRGGQIFRNYDYLIFMWRYTKWITDYWKSCRLQQCFILRCNYFKSNNQLPWQNLSQIFSSLFAPLLTRESIMIASLLMDVVILVINIGCNRCQTRKTH